jgi:hypothetical protein
MAMRFTPKDQDVLGRIVNKFSHDPERWFFPDTSVVRTPGRLHEIYIPAPLKLSGVRKDRLERLVALGLLERERPVRIRKKNPTIWDLSRAIPRYRLKPEEYFGALAEQGSEEQGKRRSPKRKYKKRDEAVPNEEAKGATSRWGMMKQLDGR